MIKLPVLVVSDFVRGIFAAFGAFSYYTLYPLLILLVFFKLEEEDAGGAAGDQGLTVEEDHLPQRLVCHLLKPVVGDVISIDNEYFPLSVE